jgi:hypothetical protein
MLESLLRTLVKVAVASLIVGTVLAHFGITTDLLMKEFGVSTESVEDLVRRGLTWALPNILLGALIIVPVWFVAFLFRPPGRSSSE